ncbi:E3 ubiquitin-protein ligase ATL4-like [Aristolochia californica]|uniref:E3 ubiquitin-protein ligase ATL4-like n=1 Tax=Aristolochia californica TaxID=171875 RepID=UPI0035E28B08
MASPPLFPVSANPPQSLNPSILIIALIVTIVFMLSLAIHLLLRYLDRHLRPSVTGHSVSPPQHSNPLFNRCVSSEQQTFIDSLPAFPFNSVSVSASADAGSHKDCAVCLAHFEPHDRLRLLPACCHAFHATCIDTWLASNRTCPLCRSTIDVALPSEKSESLGSFRLEIGSISRRESFAGSRRRSYSVGSFDYVVDDEVEVVAVTPPSGSIGRGSAKDSAEEPAAPLPPGEEVAEAAGGRGWLKEYVDRLASSASSSFSSRTLSFRLSGRLSGIRSISSRRTESWDLEGNPVGEEHGFSNFLRWLSGV